MLMEVYRYLWMTVDRYWCIWRPMGFCRCQWMYIYKEIYKHKAAFIMYYLGGGRGFFGGIQKFSGQNWGDWKFSTDL